MTGGKRLLSAALAAALCATALLAGEAVPPHPAAAQPLSIRRNASVAIGGEVRVDYVFRTAAEDRDSRTGNLAMSGTNLRIAADVHPNLKAVLKLDLTGDVAIHGERDAILEEAMLVMSAVGGSGIGFFAGRGRAPYGQDVTVGMLQSYHHAADREDSSEGRVFVTDPPDERADPANGRTPLPPMRPGQLDRVLAAGVAYEWQDRWKVELAAFQPNSLRYGSRLNDRNDGANHAGFGAAARVWWMPFEDFVLQASVIAVHSADMANMRLREDILPAAAQSGAARGAEVAAGVSAGFDFRRGPWRVFGEYQHGRDWNFTKGYNTDTAQLGAAYDIAPSWRVGAMVETLHIRDAARGAKTTYHKAALNLRHTFENGLFLLAEYAHERRRRESAGGADKTFGHFVGMRVGWAF